MAYADLLKDPRWQKKRLQIMERDKFTCRSCGDTKTTLNVHHAYYEKGKMPWEYPDESLVTWCEDCHERRQKMQNYILAKILWYTETEISGLHAFVGLPWMNFKETCRLAERYVGELADLGLVSTITQKVTYEEHEPEGDE